MDGITKIDFVQSGIDDDDDDDNDGIHTSRKDNHDGGNHDFDLHMNYDHQTSTAQKTRRNICCRIAMAPVTYVLLFILLWLLIFTARVNHRFATLDSNEKLLLVIDSVVDTSVQRMSTIVSAKLDVSIYDRVLSKIGVTFDLAMQNMNRTLFVDLNRTLHAEIYDALKETMEHELYVQLYDQLYAELYSHLYESLHHSTTVSPPLGGGDNETKNVKLDVCSG